MAKAKAKFELNNTYIVELIDSKTNELKQSGKFHNIATVGLLQSITNEWFMGIFSDLLIGSGTNTPAYTDTALGNLLWSITDVESVKPTLEWLSDYTARAQKTFTVPATSSYVGTVTEVGLRCNSRTNYGTYDGPLATHALLTDSEGQIVAFNKTDTDILKITVIVEATLSSSDANFTIFKRPGILRYLLNCVASDSQVSTHYKVGYMSLCRFYYEVENLETTIGSSSISPMSIDQIVSGGAVSGSSNASSSYITWATSRLPATTQTTERYYKAIALPGIGYWKLPNENILPAYSLSAMNIGIGDGSTVSFANPIGYFKKDTDRIYKNGVLLTRDVDYTIDNFGNKDCLPELADKLNIVKAVSDVVVSGGSTYCPLFTPSSTSKVANTFDRTTTTPAFNASNPAYIEYEEEVEINCLKSTGLYAVNSTGGYSPIPAGTKFFVDYSTDGETYTEVASIATPDTSGAFSLDFATTKAKYWRVRTNNSTNSYVALPTAGNYVTLNRKNPNIVFSEAPADGDVLTMEVDMDIIMKNSNFVVDLAARVDFTI